MRNDYNLRNVKVKVPDFGILNNYMVGTYKATGSFYGKSNPAKKLGCMELEFEFVKGESELQHFHNNLLSIFRGKQ